MVNIYSHSKLSTFEQCPFKYKLRYIDKIRPEIEKTIEAHLGSAVHDTLEWIYNTIKENPNKNFDLDEIITHYAIKWQESYTNDILIVKKQLSSKDYFNKGVEFLANYFQENAPFRDGTIECEKKVFIELDENTKLQGFIDRLVHNIETGEYEIHDYKTANTLPSQEKMNEDRQLALYSIAIKELFGKDKEVSLIWHYLAHNQKIKSKRTNLELEKLKKETKQLIRKIESTKDFPFCPSILCNWCEYKDICPAHNPNSPHQTSISQTNLDDFPTTKKYLKKFETFENNNKKELDIW
jgi:putative RecB family exonuclease